MPVPPVIQMYRYVMGSGGGVSNLLLGSEELGSTGVGRWNQDLMNAVNSDQVNNPAGTEQTADQLDFQASKSAKIRQDVTLVAGTEYTFSVWARAASATQPFRLRYYDNVGGSGGASAFTASATWSPTTGRYSFTFTAQNSGTFTMMIQNAADAVSRRIYFWGAMLNVGATAADYIKTEFTGPSSPATPLMEFGDNFAGVTAYYSLRRFTIGEDNNAIRVRRSSNDDERDIGFDANGDLDTTALLAFVNADVEKVLNGDFSNGSTNWIISNGSVTGGEYVSGTLSAYQSGIKQVPFTYTGTGTLTFDLTLNSGSLRVDDGAGLKLVTSSGAQSITLTNPNKLEFNAYNLGFDGIIDNISFIPTNVDGAVTTFYDQSGNGNNATNATASEQPLVVSGGTLVEENGKAAIEYDGAGDQLALSSAISLGDSDFSVNLVYRSLRTSSEDYVLFGSGGQSRMRLYDSQVRLYISNAIYDFASSNNFGSQYLYTLEADALRGLQVYRDGTATGSELTIASGDDFIQEFIGNGVTRPINGRLQEVIIFNSDQSGNRTGIESNINDHFSIYP